ncbi:MAG: DUF3883 domain-containing protein [Chloroflexi bacterium]|nr:DUF3883 domain-containing protein [Chloroflexota bacterium]
MDELRRYFELKAHAQEAPEDVELAANEAERAARERKQFFLAVVSGLEQGVETEVRIIQDPIHTLDWRPSTTVTLSGVRTKPSVRVSFRDATSPRRSGA